MKTESQSESRVHELRERVKEFFFNISGLFTDARNRRAVVASSVVMIAQYVCHNHNLQSLC